MHAEGEENYESGCEYLRFGVTLEALMRETCGAKKMFFPFEQTNGGS